MKYWDDVYSMNWNMAVWFVSPLFCICALKSKQTNMTELFYSLYFIFYIDL